MWDYYASYWILIPAILFTFYAQAKVSSNFKRYSKVRNDRNLTGAQAARMVLDANGLRGFPPYGLSTVPAAAARHLRCQNAR